MYNWRKAKNKNNIDVYGKIGDANRSSELMAESDEKTNFFPKGIHIEDLDLSVFTMIKEGELKLDIDGQVVPVIIMNSESWAEFSQTWSLLNEDKNLLPPFLTIKRDSVKAGTYLDVKYSIPNRLQFPYMHVPIFKDGKEGYEIHKISQPVAIDIIYEIRFFSNYLEDTNRFYEKYYTQFSGRQLYVRPNGHFMPLILEDENKEDIVDDIESQRLFVRIFNLKLTGYIQDETEFTKIEAINRVALNTKFVESKDLKKS